jgi:hypothetical protein
MSPFRGSTRRWRVVAGSLPATLRESCSCEWTNISASCRDEQVSGLCSPETELRDHAFLVIPSAVENRAAGTPRDRREGRRLSDREVSKSNLLLFPIRNIERCLHFGRHDKDHLHHRSTQSFTVSYQSREFCGLSTQWPSSGKYNISDGTFSRCNVVKRSKPCETSSR